MTTLSSKYPSLSMEIKCLMKPVNCAPPPPTPNIRILRTHFLADMSPVFVSFYSSLFLAGGGAAGAQTNSFLTSCPQQKNIFIILNLCSVSSPPWNRVGLGRGTQLGQLSPKPPGRGGQQMNQRALNNVWNYVNGPPYAHTNLQQPRPEAKSVQGGWPSRVQGVYPSWERPPGYRYRRRGGGFMLTNPPVKLFLKLLPDWPRLTSW